MTDSSDEIQLPPIPPLPAGAPRLSAHTSAKPLQADASGVSMAWKVVWALVVFIIGSGTIWTAFGLATVENLSDHNVAQAAHQVILEKNAEPVPMAAAVKATYQAQKDHQGEYEQLKQGYEIVHTVKLDLDTDRAERLADRAADKIQNSARSREVWKTVRDRAMENLSARRPIRSGLERYLD
jgi:hypothetical protein